MNKLPKYVLDAIWGGRAVLIAGQDLVRGETQTLLSSETSSTGLAPGLLHPTKALLDRIGVLRGAAPATAHVEVAQVPWALVLSSALDTRLAAALESAAPASRRIRRRFVNDVDADNLVRSATVLEVMHLSLTSDATTSDGAVPDPSRWARATRLNQPRILDHLREIVGPAYIVIVDGVSAADPLDRDVLIAAFEGLDDTQIILCDDRLAEAEWFRIALPGAPLLQGSLANLLKESIAEPQVSLRALLQANDLAVRVRVAENEERQTLVLRAEELRDIRRHVEILGDSPGLLVSSQRDERLADFRKFLRTPRHRPDYGSFALEFCLERTAYRRLRDIVARRIARIQGVAVRRDRHDSSGPIVLAGLPGSGRTTGLHWIGLQLRQQGWLVAHLSATTDDPDLFAIEQVIRLIEQRLREVGATDLVILLADGVGAEGAKRLDDRLRRAGRRAVVVATAVAIPGGESNEEKVSIEGTQVLLSYDLNAEELKYLANILNSVGITISLDVLARQAGVEGFLGMLDRLDSSAREGITQVLRGDFERFVPDLAEALGSREKGGVRGSLGDAIAAAFARARIGLPEVIDQPRSPPSAQQIATARDLLRTVFALAWLDRPAPLDLLSRRYPVLFQCYDDVRTVSKEHGFLIELDLDVDATPALAPINPGVARMLRDHVVGYSKNMMDELGALAKLVPWPAGGDAIGLPIWPKFVFDLFWSISPTGPFKGQFGSTTDLGRLLDLLEELRDAHNLRLPQSLMLEAITRREWIKNADLSIDEKAAALRESCSLLKEAAESVTCRPRSPSRDQFLANILNANATTLRHLMQVMLEGGHDVLDEVQAIAAPALAAAQRSQALQDNWHPFDAAALIYRGLATAWNEKKGLRPDAEDQFLAAVDQLGAVLDLGAEMGDLPPDQRERQESRQREYQILSGQIHLAREKALADAKEGKLAGLCYMLRQDAIDPDSNRIRSADAAGTAFAELLTYPACFDDDRSLLLLQRLWIGARLGNQSLDSGPYVVGADDEAWANLQRIAEKRIAYSGEDFDPGIGFWLAVALLQQGNVIEARRILQRMQLPGRIRKRNLDPLIVLSQQNGSARLFRALIRRREERENLLVYIRDLDLEMLLFRRYLEPGEDIDLKQGDMFEVNVALNYRGPMALGPRWTKRSIRPAFN